MKHTTKVIDLTLCFILLLTSCSCRPRTISFHATENSLPIDTMVVVPEWAKNQVCFGLFVHTEWNDTVIYHRQKKPKGKFDLDDVCVDGGTSQLRDTIKFQFDKYKATKVNISVTYKL